MPLNSTLPPPGNETLPEVEEIGTPATIGPMSERRESQEPPLPDAEIGTNEAFRVTLEDGGKIALPAALRERLGVVEGDYLVLKPQKDGTVVVVSLALVVERAMGHFSDVAPGRSLADELIAERREEARKESEE